MDRIKIFFIYILVGLSFLNSRGQQIGNYVNNGSFEDCVNCNGPAWNTFPRYWGSIDSASYCFLYCSLDPPISNLPWVGGTYQLPLTGRNILLSTIYCDTTGTCTYTYSRGYPRNRLKEPLKSNTTYCVKFNVSYRDASTLGIDAFGIYFGDATLDTIKHCTRPLTYLNPQVQNPQGNIITDTTKWISITGTFVASGGEKYAVLGNFKSISSTGTILINPPNVPIFGLGTDIYYDDVSCIELNLPAYASPDKLIYLGDSTFIGRQPDYAIDPGCIWYKLPNMTTAIDTVSGLWVKPSVTSTYVVRQELDCSSVKWDTVVVTISTNYVGLAKLQRLADNISLFPNPTSGNLNISFSGSVPADISDYSIVDNLGQIIRKEEVDLKNSPFIVLTTDLVNGFYQIHFKTKFGTVTKKFIKTN